MRSHEQKIGRKGVLYRGCLIFAMRLETLNQSHSCSWLHEGGERRHYYVYQVEILKPQSRLEIKINGYDPFFYHKELFYGYVETKYERLTKIMDVAITKYKLKKDLPDVKAGAIFERTNTGVTGIKYCCFTNNIWYNPEIIENNSEWFTPCILTTNDGVDKYEGDTVWVYYVNRDSISWLILIGKVELEENVMFFSTKEAAEKYVKSIKPKFKKGAILKNGDKSFILDEFDIEKHKNCEVLGQYPTKHDVAFDYDKTPSISKVFNRLLSIRNEMIREYNKAHKCNWEADFRMIIDKKYNTQEKWTVSRHNGCLCVTFGNFSFNHFPFPTEELAEYSLKEHEELWKIYYQL